jgi:NADH:ubiquinone oxidoreductase subunit 5 (subunit L)/multisubunit Na+/H+ antiporter MnhA subunit
MESDILIVVLAFPILGAFLLLLLKGRVQDWLAFLLPVLYLVVGVEAVRALLKGSLLRATLTSLPWLDDAGVFSLRLDALSAIMLLVVLIIGFLVMAFSIGYMGPRNKEHPVVRHEGNSRYYFFLSLFIASMVGLALAANLFVLFFFWEATTLCSWALISHYSRRPFSVMAGLKALIMTHAGGAFFSA